MQTCVDIANEYLQAYKIGGGVNDYQFCSLHDIKRAVYTMFLLFCLKFYSLTKFYSLKSIFLNSIRSKPYPQA